MWSRIKRWLYWHGLAKCKHDWVPARQFYLEYEGKDHEYLEPKPMKDGTEYQVAPYVCRKCYDHYIAIEQIEDGKAVGGVK
jgi:hypothetical protein